MKLETGPAPREPRVRISVDLLALWNWWLWRRERKRWERDERRKARLRAGLLDGR